MDRAQIKMYILIFFLWGCNIGYLTGYQNQDFQKVSENGFSVGDHGDAYYLFGIQ